MSVLFVCDISDRLTYRSGQSRIWGLKQKRFAHKIVQKKEIMIREVPEKNWRLSLIKTYIIFSSIAVYARNLDYNGKSRLSISCCYRYCFHLRKDASKRTVFVNDLDHICKANVWKRLKLNEIKENENEMKKWKCIYIAPYSTNCPWRFTIL